MEEIRLVNANEIKKSSLEIENWDAVDTQTIDDATTYDVMPVVKCKNCRYSKIASLSQGENTMLYCAKLNRTMGPDDFCSKGE